MSVNKHREHLYVIPEDDADRQIANGFALYSRVDARRVQVLDEAGGWPEVLKLFKEEYLPILQQNTKTHVVMLIDFDNMAGVRRAEFDAVIPTNLRSRVFVIGPDPNPEVLRQSFGSGGFEDIGRNLAEECDNDTTTIWMNAHLRHNEEERLRLAAVVKPFLFVQ